MLGYSECSRGYRVYNTETQIVKESISVRFDDKLDPQKSKQNESFADIEVEFTGVEGNSSEVPNRDASTTLEGNVTNITAPFVDQLQKRLSRSSIAHPEDKVLGKKDDSIRTRSTFRNFK